MLAASLLIGTCTQLERNLIATCSQLVPIWPEQTEDIVNYIINEFVHTIEHVNWMDESTRSNAVDKARAMRTYIGYTDELRNSTKIDQLYEKAGDLRAICSIKLITKKP